MSVIHTALFTTGLHVGMPREVYDADPVATPALTASLSKILVAESPLHAYTASPRLNPNFVEEESDKFDIGNAAHLILWERKQPHVCDFKDWRTNAAKEERDSARAAGKIPLLPPQSLAVNKMVFACRNAIGDCEDLKPIDLDKGTPEATIIWQCRKTWCRSRLDWICPEFSPETGLILDYKTTESANPISWWQRIAMRTGADIQAAFYIRAAQSIYPQINWRFVFVVQQTSAPYATSFIGVDPTTIELGSSKVDYAVDTWQQCLDSKSWPGYSQKVHWAAPPEWASSDWHQRQFDRLMDRPANPETVDMWNGVK